MHHQLGPDVAAGVTDVPTDEEAVDEDEPDEHEVGDSIRIDPEEQVLDRLLSLHIILIVLRQLGDPLDLPSWSEVVAWTTMVVDAITMEVEPVPVPKIHAPDVDSAACVLIFLVRWLISDRTQHAEEPPAGGFQGALEHAFGEDVVCDLTSLEQLLRHADAFEVQACVYS